MHNNACFALKEELGRHSDPHLKPMLFDGQGLLKVFECHRIKLGQKLNENYFAEDSIKIKEFKKQLDLTKNKLDESLEIFRKNRIKAYLANISPSTLITNNSEIEPKLYKYCNSWFDSIFTTVAFQSALICGFFEDMENYNLSHPTEKIDIHIVFEEYLEDIGNFFIPKSFSKLKTLINVFEGKPSGENASELAIIHDSANSFRKVVHRGEMQPDQWPKYKYLLSECWSPKNVRLKNYLNERIILVRKEIFKALYFETKKEYLTSKSILEDNLEKPQMEEIFNNTYENYKSFLTLFGRGGIITKLEMKKALN